MRVDDLDVTEDGRPFIVMEHVQGKNLREVIREEGAFEVPRAAAIGRQVASALAAAHAIGITHRDIKPDNILLTVGPDGQAQAKVLDFGIAKVREGSFDVGPGYTPTETGMVVGTPQYVSPEQAMGKRGDDLDGRSDLYSLGVTLYEMITGRLPFESTTPMEMILHHVQTPPPAAPEGASRPRPPAGGERAADARAAEGARARASARPKRWRRRWTPLTVLPATACRGAPGGDRPRRRRKTGGFDRDRSGADAHPAAAVERRRRASGRGAVGEDAVEAAARPDEAEAAPRSSSGALVGSALVILAVVGAIAWRSNARARPVAPVPRDPPPRRPRPSPRRPRPPTADPWPRPSRATPTRASRTRSNGCCVLVPAAQPAHRGRGRERDRDLERLRERRPSPRSSRESFASSASGVRRVFNTLRVPAAPPAAAAAAPPPAPADAASEDTTRRPPRDDGERDREATRELMEKAKREMEAGNTAAAVAACQEVLRIDPNHPHARDCVERGSRRGGPPPRRQ